MQPDNSSVIVVAFKLKPKFYLEMKTVAEILKKQPKPTSLLL